MNRIERVQMGAFGVNTDYGGKYLSIRKAIHDAEFDEFYQAGSITRYSAMNIVAESSVLQKRFWFCVDGDGSLYVLTREYGASNDSVRVKCRTQSDMVKEIHEIKRQIEVQNSLITAPNI